ncbi:hypothetical protein Y032_0136g1982 [Ancylostoma ceylanicum]|uniref:BTB domain-containing protein n=1 Tax=Ancylostoma ceylanicum TaxID=53326 RepID=A0A016T5D3_9BILA|nr:hypothetical protein Y032_0136g1982 [Ancylostoma ceylanicum]
MNRRERLPHYRYEEPISARHNYDRLLQLADRSQLGHAHRVPELPPKMGLRVKDKSRLSTGALEQSLPDKLTQALRNLRPGALVHSASSSAAHSSKSGVVPADDVVYIASPEASQISSHFEEMRRRRHSAMMRLCPSQSPSPVLMRNAYRREHGHPRGMFKSVPNVNVVEEKEKEYRRRRRRSCHVFGDEADAESSSTRSPTDSGYRSTPRQTSGENLCTYDEISPTRISHKTTTVVYVNGESSNAEDNQVVKAHGASHTALDSHLLRFGVVCKDPGCPFDERDLITLLNRKSLSKDSQCFDVSYVPRLIDMLLNTLEIITDHVQRLSINSAKATVENVTTTTKIVFPLEVSWPCIKAANQAMALYSVSGQGALKRSMSHRASLNLSVGRMYHWLVTKLPNKPISESMPVYLTAVLERAMEEMLRPILQLGRKIAMNRRIEDITRSHKSLVSFFARTTPQKELDPMVAISEKDLLEAINDSRGREVMETNGFLLSSKGKQRSLIQMSSSGLQCLRYFILNQSGRSNVVPIADWTRIIFAFAEHRMSHTVDETDVQQAARVLLGCDCAPPSVSVSCRDFSDLSLEDAKKEFAFSLAASASPMHMQHVSSLLDGQWSATNQFGLCLTSAAVLRSDGDALQRLIDMGFPTNVPIPASIGDKRPFLLVEYSGWTPLTWAVATRNTMCTDILLASKAQVQSDDMIKESPIQVAAQQGCEDVVRRLLCAGADPFRSTIEYDSSKASFRSIGSPSALAIACSRGHSLIVDIFVDRLLQNFPTTVIDFLSDSQTKVKDIGKIEFKRLPKNTRLALQEALYYAVETSQPECALQLWKCGCAIGVPRGELCIPRASEQESCATKCKLFSHLNWECRRDGGHPEEVASVISRMWKQFQKPDTTQEQEPGSPETFRPTVGVSFVNNPELSDIRFTVEGENVYAHRIMLYNASDRFKEMLKIPSGNIDITDVSHTTFLAMLHYIYTGKIPELSIQALCCLYAAAELYLIPALCSAILRDLGRILSPQNAAYIYQFAIVHNNSILLEKGEIYLLTNLDVLITQAKIRDLIKSHSADYYVCAALSKRLSSAFSASLDEKL